jgi:hypothetical protein
LVPDCLPVSGMRIKGIPNKGKGRLRRTSAEVAAVYPRTLGSVSNEYLPRRACCKQELVPMDALHLICRELFTNYQRVEMGSQILQASSCPWAGMKMAVLSFPVEYPKN